MYAMFGILFTATGTTLAITGAALFQERINHIIDPVSPGLITIGLLTVALGVYSFLLAARR